VVDGTTEETTVVVDSPKIIIAVFERIEYSTLTELDTIRPGIGRGGAMAVGTDFRIGPKINPGGRKDRDWDWPKKKPPPDFPVPDDDTGHDFPVPDDEPIPEPATIAMIGLGAILLKERKHK